MRTLSAILLTATALAAPAPPAAGAGPANDAKPVLAVEDTMRTEVPPVLVNARRVTLAELLDRVAAGEARRDSLLRDQSYQRTIRTVGHAADGKGPKLVEEIVARVYLRKPDRSRTVTLREWKAKPPKEPGPRAEVRVETGRAMREDIVDFAFQPSARRNYKYRIVGREILGDHVVYRIAFEPRSALDVAEPSGEVWVDTRDDVIVRQEITFRRSPVPMFLRGIDRMVVERQFVDGFWVLSRVIARVRTTVPIPQYGTSMDFSMAFTDYTVNTGLPDSLFAAAPAARPKEGGR